MSDVPRAPLARPPDRDSVDDGERSIGNASHTDGGGAQALRYDASNSGVRRVVHGGTDCGSSKTKAREEPIFDC